MKFDTATVLTADWLPPYEVDGAEKVAFWNAAKLASTVVVVEQLDKVSPPEVRDDIRTLALDLLLSGGLTIKVHATRRMAEMVASALAKHVPDAKVFIVNSSGIWRRVAG